VQSRCGRRYTDGLRPSWRRSSSVPSSRKWRNWQTHQLEGLALARAWGFESPLPHQIFKRPEKSGLFPLNRRNRSRSLTTSLTLTLSAGGVGLLATLLTTVGPTSHWNLVLYVIAGLSFLTAIACGVFVQSKNAEYLGDILKTPISGNSPELQFIDQAIFISFSLGVVLTGALAVSAGMARLQERETMSDQRKNESRTTPLRESLKGLATLRPDQQKSLTGLAEFRPAPIAETQKPASTAQTSGGGSGEASKK
jgi:hypothetical protein